MTSEEREIALYCLKASSDYHSEVCEECVKYPNCDHMIQDDVTETIIKALEQTELNPSYNSVKSELNPCEDCISRNELLSRIDAERKHLLDIKMDGAEHVIVHHARRIIEDMPSITPKALEQQTSEDCISREEVIDEINRMGINAFKTYNDYSELFDFVDSLPSLTPQQLSVTNFADKCKECGKILNDKLQTRWIPVTEDAPPKGVICLWCNTQGSVFASEITYRSERISYVGKHGYFHNGLENYGNIVAWMPLPEPYKAESKIEQAGAYADQDTLMSAT